jgi:ABC-type polysaccharide/polyol phosphate transport system ATPase subunit/ABC-type polysaccharide/polyol phosphate export permease
VIEPQAFTGEATAATSDRVRGDKKPCAISVDGVVKTFLVPSEPYTSLKRRWVDLFRPQHHEARQVLDGVSFEVGQGEFFGVAGPNGSGKSTLLKIIAGIYRADSGSVRVAGLLSPFLEMGVGFNDELTARENVVLNGTLLGFSPAEIHERRDEIIAFGDLEEFADMPLKNFSSGMRVRLAFALAMQVDADILLLDEVLAVGDDAFKQKCYDEFRRFKEEGRTVILVTHSMAPMSEFCDRAMLLDEGRVLRIGDADSIAEAYRELNADLARQREAVARRHQIQPRRDRPSRARRLAGALGPLRTYRFSPLGGDFRRFARITNALAKTDFKLHYQGSVLGIVWTVMKPLLLFAVIYAVFSGILRTSTIDHYPLYVLSGLVLWMFFTEATGKGVGSLVKHKNLLRKMRFPPLAIPVSAPLQALFNLGVNGLLVVGVAIAIGIEPRLSWLELPVLILLLAMLTTGVVLLLSTLYVRYRDVEHIWRVFERALFFATPIIYPTTRYPEEFQHLAAMTPLVMIFTQMRHAFIDPSAPSAAALAGGTLFLLVPLAITAAILIAGLLMFTRQAPLIAERL